MPACFDDLCLVEPSPTARRLLWHVLSVGSVWRDEPETHPARDKAGAFLFWVVSGVGKLHVGNQVLHLEPGARFWWVDLGVPRAYVPEPNHRLMTAGIRFSGPGIDTWSESLQCNQEFNFDNIDDAERIKQCQKTIQELVRLRPSTYEWDIHQTITHVLGILLHQRQVLISSEQSDMPVPVARVMEIVLSDPLRPWRAGELASLVDVSYSSLRAMFRESQNESLSDFLQKTRLHQARLLLVNDALSMKEISARMNFSSEFYFSQWFRNQTGVSPSTFRSSLRD